MTFSVVAVSKDIHEQFGPIGGFVRGRDMIVPTVVFSKSMRQEFGSVGGWVD